MHSPQASPLVFISHSSADQETVAALVALLRAALNLSPDEIRATSVDGYRLPIGEATDERLRQEVLGAELLIALLSQHSLASTYVLFELGGRWGAGRPIAPVLVPGLDASSLKGPLAGLNALSAGSEAQLHQLVEEVAKLLGRKLNSPAAFLGELRRLSESHPQAARSPAAPEPVTAGEPALPGSSSPPALSSPHIALLALFAQADELSVELSQAQNRLKWKPAKFGHYFDQLCEMGFLEQHYGSRYTLTRTGRALAVKRGLTES